MFFLLLISIIIIIFFTIIIIVVIIIIIVIIVTIIKIIIITIITIIFIIDSQSVNRNIYRTVDGTRLESSSCNAECGFEQGVFGGFGFKPRNESARVKIA